MNTSALFATLFLGVFVLIGVITVYITKNSEKLVHFTIGASLTVMCLLVALEIFPEALNIAISKLNEPGGIIHIAAFTFIGIILLALLDRFMPDHANSDDNEKFMHIGIITSIAIVLHNVVEGAGLYAVYSTSPSLGILLSISVGLHNIPLGMMIASAFYGKKESTLKYGLILFMVSSSSFFGGLVIYLLKLDLEGSLYTASLLAISSGMLLYIVFMELLPQVRAHLKQKEMLLGLGFGAIIFITGMMLI